MRIGELAERTQTPVDTIRYYERAGLLPKPDRTASNYRAYSVDAAQRRMKSSRCENNFVYYEPRDYRISFARFDGQWRLRYLLEGNGN